MCVSARKQQIGGTHRKQIVYIKKQEKREDEKGSRRDWNSKKWERDRTREREGVRVVIETGSGLRSSSSEMRRRWDWPGD